MQTRRDWNDDRSLFLPCRTLSGDGIDQLLCRHHSLEITGNVEIVSGTERTINRLVKT